MLKNGFYKELDEIREDDPEATFGFLEVVCNMGRFQAFDFLHGYCLDFALMLSDELGYKIEDIRSPEGFLIHAYCVAEAEGEKLYIDVRGVTNDPELFFGEFEDEVDFADGEFWCQEDQARIEVFDDSEAYLKAYPEKELFLDYAKGVMEWNRDYYDVTDDEVVQMLRDEASAARPSVDRQIQDALDARMMAVHPKGVSFGRNRDG